MFCRERRKLIALVEEAVDAYRTAVDSVIQCDGAAPAEAMDRANDAYHTCQVRRTALRRHERAHGCPATVTSFARSA